MRQINLTQPAVNSAQCLPSLTKQEITDRECKGLVLEVRRSGGKTYYLRYTNYRGKQRQYRIGNATVLTLYQARHIARLTLNQIATGHDPSEEKAALKQVPTFGQFIHEQYLPHVKTYKRSWTTDVSYLKNHLLPRFANRYMDQITRQDILKMHRERSTTGAAGSANRLLIMMRFIFNLAMRWEVPGIKANPCAAVPLLEENNKRERYLSSDEARVLYESVCKSDNQMLKYIIPMLILTGARKREVLDAKWEDFDLERRLWRIPTTKLGKPRHVPISDGVLSLLGSAPRVYAVDHVFANPATGKPYVTFYVSWNTARIRAGMPEVRIHDLRHSFASLLINNGRSLYEVQKILGHTQVKTTQRYAHLAPQTLLDASNAATLAVGAVMGVMPNRVIDVPLVMAG